ncbi:Protocadherin Fat 4, partial [Trichinella pseudospiralis]
IRVCDLVSCVHGTCKYNLFENGDYVSFCDCNPGFQGNDCSIDIDECADEGNYPCLNNGTCFNDVGSYHCQCSIKFEGVHCEKTYKKFNPLHTQQLIARFSDITIFLEIDPCGSNPCSNQATCITLSDDPKEYECQCQIGFEGRLCEISNKSC